MKEFFMEGDHKRGGTPGQAFTGKVLRDILAEKSLEKLETKLGAKGEMWLTYLSYQRGVLLSGVSEGQARARGED